MSFLDVCREYICNDSTTATTTSFFSGGHLNFNLFNANSHQIVSSTLILYYAFDSI